MRISIKNVQIAAKGFNPGESYHVSVVDGKIAEIGPSSSLAEAELEIDGSGCWLSAGWCDLRAHFNDPGMEHKEDLESGALAAADGGFTAVALLPNTEPALDNKKGIRYILSGNSQRLTQLYPLGAVSIGAKGEELAEMMDLRQAGALAFTDGTRPITNTALLLKSLQYLLHFNGLLINHPTEASLVRGGQMHEGINSTLLGMKGMPVLAEEMAIERDLRLLEYAGGRLHFSGISTAAGVDLVRNAKARGLAVSCDVSVAHLVFTDNALLDFDTNYKVNPPLRQEEDRKALIDGLKDGTIDAIVTDHQPQDTESKKLEFDLAEFGMMGLQTFYASLLKAGVLDASLLAEKVSHAPRRLLGLPSIEIKAGESANLTLFSPEFEWQFTEETNFSKGINSPFFNQTLRGKALGVIANGMHHFHSAVVVKTNG
ncbi:dihydroorotase [Nafulsella turpanensis]|uniref:dihydroorotase n=1 Tax=Nafulsella turpanensis TaxID=1265690 RepID=UPI00034BEC17|nr:dihydroorotase [Nafulsella turpanensis]